MHKFEAFLKRVLTVIFSETPFDKQKADKSLEKIRKETTKEDNK